MLLRDELYTQESELAVMGTGILTVLLGGQCIKVMFSTSSVTELMCTFLGCSTSTETSDQMEFFMPNV